MRKSEAEGDVAVLCLVFAGTAIAPPGEQRGGGGREAEPRDEIAGAGVDGVCGAGGRPR